MSKIKDVFLADYAVPTFLISHIDLDVDIGPDHARVTTKLKLRRNPKSKNKKAPLVLQGEAQKLISVRLGKKALTAKQYKLTPHDLTVPDMPELNSSKGALLEIVSSHNPYKNTTLAGLYASGAMLSTQCEAPRLSPHHLLSRPPRCHGDVSRHHSC